MRCMRRLDELVASLEHVVVQNVLHNDKNTDVIILSERLVRGLRGRGAPLRDRMQGAPDRAGVHRAGGNLDGHGGREDPEP